MVKFFDAVVQFLIRVFGPRPKNEIFEIPVEGSIQLLPALRLIKKWEGFRSRAYRDPVGIWTIGYGTIRYANGMKVQPGQSITEEEASVELQAHIEKDILPHLKKLVKVPLNNNQFCALVSLIYNIGAGAFGRSTLLRKLNKADYEGAAREFDRWVYAGGRKLRGLVRRRDEEEALFLLPKEGRVN